MAYSPQYAHLNTPNVYGSEGSVMANSTNIQYLTPLQGGGGYKQPTYYGPAKDIKDLIKKLGGMESGFYGINSIGDIKGKFGVPDVRAAFDPGKQALGQQKGMALAGASQRAGDSATAERSIFSGIEQHFANAYTQLLGQEAQAQVDQDSALAGMLMNIIGGRDEFNLGKAGMVGGLHGTLLQDEQFYKDLDLRRSLGQQSLDIQREANEGDLWDFLGGAIGTVAGFLI